MSVEQGAGFGRMKNRGQEDMGHQAEDRGQQDRGHGSSGQRAGVGRAVDRGQQMEDRGQQGRGHGVRKAGYRGSNPSYKFPLAPPNTCPLRITLTSDCSHTV